MIINIVGVAIPGQSFLRILGSGTIEDPFTYSFNLFEDDNSNDRVLNLLEKDLIVEASGEDPITGDFIEVSEQTINHPFSCFWEPVNIVINYLAEHVNLVNDTDTIDPSVPLRIARKGLALLVAAELLENDEGGDKQLAATFRTKYKQSLDKSLGHRTRQAVPFDASPG